MMAVPRNVGGTPWGSCTWHTTARAHGARRLSGDAQNWSAARATDCPHTHPTNEGAMLPTLPPFPFPPLYRVSVCAILGAGGGGVHEYIVPRSSTAPLGSGSHSTAHAQASVSSMGPCTSSRRQRAIQGGTRPRTAAVPPLLTLRSLWSRHPSARSPWQMQSAPPTTAGRSRARKP